MILTMNILLVLHIDNCQFENKSPAENNSNKHNSWIMMVVSWVVIIQLKKTRRYVSADPSPIIAMSYQSVCQSVSAFCEFCSNWICQSCSMDFSKLLDGFVKIDRWISLSCFMDLSKLIHGYWISLGFYMDLSKLIHEISKFLVLLPFSKQNHAKVWPRFQRLLKRLLWTKGIEWINQSLCLWQCFLFLQDQYIQRPTTFQKCPDVSNAKNREHATTSKKENSPTEMVTKAANTFSKVLYKELRKRNKENLIVSSFSLSTVLAMISPGAKGATLKEVPVSFLSLHHSKTKMHPNPLQRPFPDVVTKGSNF